MKNEIKRDNQGNILKVGDKVCFLNAGFRCYTGLCIGKVVGTQGRYVEVEINNFTFNKQPSSLFKLYVEGEQND